MVGLKPIAFILLPKAKNMWNPEGITILDLAKEIIKITGSKSNIIYKPLPTDDPIQRQPDISLAKTKIGWEPSIDRKKGLKRTIEYFRDKLMEIQ